MLILILIDDQYLQNAGFSFEKTKISISMKMIWYDMKWYESLVNASWHFYDCGCCPFKQINISFF